MTSRKDYAGLLKDIRASEVKKVQMASVDIDGHLRGLSIQKDLFLKVAEGGMRVSGALFHNERMPQPHPDVNLAIDLRTCRSLPWAQETPFFLGDLETLSGQPLPSCPRQLLKSVIDRLYKAGFTTSVSTEYQWETRGEGSGVRWPHHSIEHLSRYEQHLGSLIKQVDDFDVPIDSLVAGPVQGSFLGQIAYADALEAADRAVLFKLAVRQHSEQRQTRSSFMACTPQSVNSGHVAMSLLHADGRPAFHDDKAKPGLLMRQFIAGVLRCLPEMMVMYAPNVNSYKRFLRGSSFVATHASWGVDHQGCAIRVVNDAKKLLRTELRVPGADANPYLVMAAALAAGLYGIEQKLRVDDYKTSLEDPKRMLWRNFPRNLYEALELFAGSELLREILGQEFVDVYIESREREWQEFERSLTDWECERYGGWKL